MSETAVLKAEVRTKFGKGAARQLRREGKLPGVLYGHGHEVLHLALDTHEVFLAIKGQSNVVLKVLVDGEEQLALVKDVQVDPVRRVLEHIDFVIVRRGEKVSVEVPVALEGEVAGKAVATVDLLNIKLLVPATDIPETITVDVEGLEDGDVVRVSDLKLPGNAECEDDPETPVVVVAVPPEEPEAETEEESAGEETASVEEESQADSE